MKETIPQAKNSICRFIVKTGSVLFLLFLTVVSPLAPAVAQVGSALFLFLVITLSPLLNTALKPAAAELPAPEEITQSADIKCLSSSFAYSGQHNNALNPTAPERVTAKPTVIKPPEVELPKRWIAKFIHYQTAVSGQLDEYLINTQPPRAGPELI